MSEQSPIDRAATALEAAIRRHPMQPPLIPGIAAPTLGATMHDLAGAAFASIDIEQLARVLHPGIVEPRRTRLLDAWESAGLDPVWCMTELEAMARRDAASVVAHLRGEGR